jgi:DNA (cytosine-5)-methyltransferase 1
MNEYLTAAEVSQRLACSEQYVRRLVRDRRLPAIRHGKVWMIPETGLDDYPAQPKEINSLVADRPRRSARLPKYRALSFFSGALGLDLGLEQAGLEVLLTCELDRACRQTITANRPEGALIGDILAYSAKDIRELAGLRAQDELHLMVGGPPCQAFSTAGKRQGFQDKRGNVFLTYVERILELRPHFAVIENVRGLLSAALEHRPHEERGPEHPPLRPAERQGGALRHIIHQLRVGGYEVSFNLYNSANFGVPQVRERVIMICSRDGRRAPFLTPTHAEGGAHGLPAWRTVREAFTSLETTTHHAVSFPEKRLKYYRLLGPGQYWKHLPDRLQREALGASFHSGGGKTGFFRRLAWDRPSPTLVTHPAMPATDLCHPEALRPLSIEEYKRIQQFPDDWQLAGSLLEQYRQVGNAVPVGLGAAVGRHILQLLAGRVPQAPKDFAFSRYAVTDDVSWEQDFALRSRRDDQLALVLN